MPRYEEEVRPTKLVAPDTPEFVVADPSKLGKIEVDRKALAVKLWPYRHGATLTASELVCMERRLLETE